MSDSKESICLRIPGICDRYLIRVDSEKHINPLLKVVELTRQAITKSRRQSHRPSKRYFKRSQQDITKPFPAILCMTHKPMTFEDLPNLQNALNKSYAYSYGIVVFRYDSCLPLPGKKALPVNIKPIYDGNPRAVYQVPILQYEINKKIEYCGIRDVGKAFGVEKYCANCMRGGPQCPCDIKINI